MRPDVSYARALLGKQLCGKWRLSRILGSGGMSTVFEGLHRNGKRVAIKVLHPELAANARIRSRFKREAYVANQVDHADAVSIIDDDVSNEGLVFLVMEYLDGETLGRRLERNGAPLPAAEVITVAIAVLDVLAAAHRCGVVHRDIKPDNIFVLRRERRVKLLDFGIASLREMSEPELTGVGASLGTPAFMAPEQARGRSAEVDETTDLWGVGATMFTLLTGRLVHPAENASETVIAAATCPAPPLRSVRGDIDAPIAAIVDRALAFERTERWTDATAMRSALRELAADPSLGLHEESVGPVPCAPCEQRTEDESEVAPEPTSMPVPTPVPWAAGVRAMGRRTVVAVVGLAVGATIVLSHRGAGVEPGRLPPLLVERVPQETPAVAAIERVPDEPRNAPSERTSIAPAPAASPVRTPRVAPRSRLSAAPVESAIQAARPVESAARPEPSSAPTDDPLDRR
jgi:serine/threonine-protein kinase